MLAKSTRPPHVMFSGVRRLTWRTLEQAEIGLNYAGGPAGRPLVCDLARVEWADAVAVVQLAATLDHAIRVAEGVTLLLPCREEMAWEAGRAAGSQARSRENRVATYGFLQHLRLAAGLTDRAERLGGRFLVVIDQDDEELLRGGAIEIDFSGSQDLSDDRELYNTCFPLTWLPPSEGSGVKTDDIVAFLSRVLSHDRGGLRGPDAEAITNVVFHELIDNVRVHAACDQAVVAAWIRPSHLPPKPTFYPAALAPFFQWFEHRGCSCVEIMVADGGRGLPQHLEPFLTKDREAVLPSALDGHRRASKVIAWSFDRFSTSTDRSQARGTRGLYRVDRVVRKYCGLLACRADQDLVARDHSGDSTRWLVAHPKGPSIAGTRLYAVLPTMAGKAPRIPLRLEPDEAEDHAGEITEFGFHKVSRVGPEGLDHDEVKKLEEALSGVPERGALVLDFSGCELPSRDIASPRDVLFHIVDQLAEHRHPPLVVAVQLPGGWDLAEGVLSPTPHDEEVPPGHPESRSEEVRDPILVLGRSTSATFTHFAKGDPVLAAALDALMREGGEASVTDLWTRVEPLARGAWPGVAEEGPSRLTQLLRGDQALVASLGNDVVRLRWNPTRLLDAVRQALWQHIEGNGDAVRHRGVLMTPSLETVSLWVDMRSLVSAAAPGPAVTALALSYLVHRLDPSIGDRGVDWVVASEGVSHEAAEALAHQFGARVRFLGDPRNRTLPEGVRLFNRGERVLVFSDILSSGDSSHRMIRQILRDDAIPVAVASIVDGRHEPRDELEVWGVSVSLCALLRLDITCASDPQSLRYLDPITNDIEPPAGRGLANPEDVDLVPPGAVHLSHIGTPTGRHYSVYLDPGQVVTNADLRTRAVGIVRAAAGERLGEIELWHPLDSQRDAAAATLARDLGRELGLPAKSVRAIRREGAHGRWLLSASPSSAPPHVVIVDWGAVGGTSLTRMLQIAAAAGTRAVTAVVLVSQLPHHRHQFFTQLRAICLESPVAASEAQTDLLLPLQTRPNDVTVRVHFLTRIPIRPFTPYDCPVCKQLSRMSREDPPEEILRAFIVRQRLERLRLRDQASDLRSPASSDFDGRDLPHDQALVILKLRIQLQGAYASTALRHRISTWLDRVLAGIRDATGTISAEAIATARFLSVETEWLHEPPLALRRCRETLVKIGLAMALSVEADEDDRINGVILLRSASKGAFVSHLRDLCRAAATNRKLFTEVAYAVFTYLDRPYLQTPSSLSGLKDALLDMTADPVITEQLTAEARQLVEDLEERAATQLETARHAHQPKAAVWRKLRDHLRPFVRSRHWDVIRDFNVLRLSSLRGIVLEAGDGGDSLSEGLQQRLRTLDARWRAPRRLLHVTVRPLLAHFVGILRGVDAHLFFDPLTLDRLVRWAEGSMSLVDGEFSQLIASIKSDPKRVGSRDLFDAYVSWETWLWDLFFRAPSSIEREDHEIDPLDVDALPQLLAFLDSIPSSLDESLRNVATHNLRVEVQGHTSAKLFLPKNLLTEVLEQLVENGNKYSTEEVARLGIESSVDGEANVLFRFFNTDPTRGEGDRKDSGLAVLRRRLEPFDATLEWGEGTREDGVSFFVRMTAALGE